MEKCDQYHLFQRIVGVIDNPVELYPLDSLTKIISRPNIQNFVNLIVEKNKIGIAPLSSEVKNEFHNFYETIKILKENQIINSVNIMQAAYLLSKRKNNGLDFSLLPENVQRELENYRCGRGSTSSWNKRFKNMHSSYWPKFYISLFYDENGPVYKNCFPHIELKYIKRNLVYL